MKRTSTPSTGSSSAVTVAVTQCSVSTRLTPPLRIEQELVRRRGTKRREDAAEAAQKALKALRAKIAKKRKDHVVVYVTAPTRAARP